MPYITTLTYCGGMLHVPIPRALVRELELVKRQCVVIARDERGGLLVHRLAEYLRERRALRPDRSR